MIHQMISDWKLGRAIRLAAEKANDESGADVSFLAAMVLCNCAREQGGDGCTIQLENLVFKGQQIGSWTIIAQRISFDTSPSQVVASVKLSDLIKKKESAK